jgi:hypothetical protein
MNIGVITTPCPEGPVLTNADPKDFVRLTAHVSARELDGELVIANDAPAHIQPVLLRSFRFIERIDPSVKRIRLSLCLLQQHLWAQPIVGIELIKIGFLFCC